MKEVIEFRSTFGGDKNAINRHSVRYYEHEDVFYRLDRNLSGSPPFFSLERLWHVPSHLPFGQSSIPFFMATFIHVGSEIYFCVKSGSSKKAWNEAVAKITPIILGDTKGREKVMSHRQSAQKAWDELESKVNA